jgi:WD40 repeat protein
VIRIRDPSLRELGKLRGHDNWVRDLRFRPSDGALVSAGFDGWAFLWKGLPDADGTRLTERSSPMESLAISPDGRTIATGNAEGEVVLWDLGERAARRADRPTQGGHSGSVTGVAYDPTGRWLITADQTGTLRLWGADRSLAPNGVLGQSGAIEGIAPTGRARLVSVGDGGPAQWTFDRNDLARSACAVAGRNLDDEEARQYGFDRVPRTCPDAPDG